MTSFTRKVQLRKPYFPSESIGRILDNVKASLESGILTLGPHTRRFEENFAKYLGCSKVLGVTSATAGLHVALLALGITSGEVIVPSKTFVSTANAPIYCGAKPVFCDADPSTYNMDINYLKRVITEKTKAIIVVHVAGHPCEMTEIMELARSRSIPVVEDAAHAHGAEYKNRKCGTIGDIGVFSFYPDKILSSSDGGAIVTDDDKIAEKVHLLRNIGRPALGQYDVLEIGYNYRMNEMQAILANEQLSLLPFMLEKRRSLAERYNKNLKEVDGIVIPYSKPYVRHSYYAYVIRVLGIERMTFRNTLLEKGVESSPMFDPVYLSTRYLNMYEEYKIGLNPVSEQISKETISIPLHPALSEDDIDYVSDVLLSTMRAQRKTGSQNH